MNRREKYRRDADDMEREADRLTATATGLREAAEHLRSAATAIPRQRRTGTTGVATRTARPANGRGTPDLVAALTSKPAAKRRPGRPRKQKQTTTKKETK